MITLTCVPARESLLTRTVVAAFLINACALLALTGLAVIGQKSALDHQYRLRAEGTAGFLAAQCELAFLVGDARQLEQLAAAAIAGEDIVYVEFSDGVRQIRKERPYDRLEGLLEVTRDVAGARNELMEWSDGKQAVGKLGTVRLGVSLRARQAAFLRTVMGAAVIVVLSLSLVLIALVGQLRRKLDPLANLIASSREIGNGNLRHRARVERHDEVGALAEAFNEMTAKLRATTVSKDFVDNIIHSMGEGLIVLDTNAHIIKLNQAAADLLGRPLVADWQGRPITDFISGDVEEGTGVERPFHRAGQDPGVVLLSTSALRGEGGEGDGWVVVMQDLTARKASERELLRAKEEAEAANQARSAFLAGVTHELRSPLTSIIWSSEMLEEEFEADGMGQYVDDLRKISRAGKALLMIVNDVLDLAKLEAGKMQLIPAPFSVRNVLSEVAQTAEPLAVKNHNRVVIEDLVHQPVIDNDAQKFRQSLLNLVSNACKFTREGVVTIRAESEIRDGRDFVAVSVADTGIGIPLEKQGLLFQAFSQVDSSDGRHFGGTGLGLAISRRFCRMMGGDLTFESEPGMGSIFSFRVPVSPDVSDENRAMEE